MRWQLIQPHEWLMVGYAVVSVAILLWDVLLAGQIANARRQSRLFLALTSICGLFVVPAALIALAASTVVTGRVIYLVAWLWPLLLLFFVAQSGYALLRRHVTSFFALPIFVYNCVLFVVALTRYASGWIDHLPSMLSGLVVAQAGALGILFGREALSSPWLLLLPLLSPAYPAAWRVSKSVRALLALSAATTVVVMTMEYPRAVYAAASFSTFGSDRLQERPRGDFSLGLRLFPALDGPPAPLPLERDLALADTVDARVISVTILPAGAQGASLDSLAVSLDNIRRDSVMLVVSLGYGGSDGAAYRQSPSRYMDRRLALLEQILRRVRPDVLVPALDPLEDGARALGRVSPAWWRDYIERSAALAHRLRPRTRVGFAVSSFSPSDSALYAWGEQTRGVDLLGFSLSPSFTGGTSLAARLRLAERWMRRSKKEQWIWGVRGFPQTFGEANQQLTIWGVVAWATSQPQVRTVIVDGAGDYETLVGMRAPGGRLRSVVASVARARRALAETAEGR